MELGLFLIKLLTALSIGCLGAYIGYKIKLPVWAFLGALLAVALFQITFGAIMERPSWLRLIVQIAVGIMVGTNFEKITVKELKALIIIALTIGIILVCGGVLVGCALKTYSGWDLITCLLSTMPGGQTEMAIFSDSMQAQTEKVIILQLARSQLVLIVLFPLVRAFVKKGENNYEK